MSQAASRWRTVVWWALPFAALALLLGLETDWGRHVHRLPDPPPTIEPKAVASAVIPEYRIEGGLPAHAETVNRTLFNPTRRPAPTLSDGGPRQMQRGQFVLTGTAVAGDRHIAFLREVAGGKSRSVRQGEQINGLVVADVGADRVKLTLGDESEELVLKVAAGPKTTIAPPLVLPPGVAPPATPSGAAPIAVPAAVAPPVPAPSPTPGAQPVARRAQAAAAAAAAAAGSTPAPGAPANPTPAPAPPAPVESQAASPDPAWNEVYERMRQRNPNYPK